MSSCCNAFEVEQKHRVDDVAALVERAGRARRDARAAGRAVGPILRPSGPRLCADRRSAANSHGRRQEFVTYKGPKLDATTKTRRELELPLARRRCRRLAVCRTACRRWASRPCRPSARRRRPFHIDIEGSDVEGALDEVDGVGTFVELELQADDANLDDAQASHSPVGRRAELGPSERRSYLEMLLATVAR